jgi:NAD(P)-dependent dehydrogenase (short-subunit alcohol dehydrogenase family)
LLFLRRAPFTRPLAFEYWLYYLWERENVVNSMSKRRASNTLKSVYLCSQAVLPMMQRRGRGKITNMTSVAARTGGAPGSVAHATAKGA